MTQCVMLHQGAFSQTESFKWPHSICAGCCGKTDRTENKRLGYGNHYFEVAVPLCKDCAAVEKRRQEIESNVASTKAGCLFQCLLAAVVIAVASVYHIVWWQTLLLTVLALVVVNLLVEPLIYRLVVSRKCAQWLRAHPSWPATLPVVDLRTGSVRKPEQVDFIVDLEHPATGEEWTCITCGNEQYAGQLAKEYDAKVVPLASAPKPYYRGARSLIHHLVLLFSGRI